MLNEPLYGACNTAQCCDSSVSRHHNRRIDADPLHRPATDVAAVEVGNMIRTSRHVMIADAIYLLICILCVIVAIHGIDPVTLSLIPFFSLLFRFMAGTMDITRETAGYMAPVISVVQRKDRISSALQVS